MGKSITSTLFSLLVKDGTYTLEQPAPVPLWHQAPGDPRATIRNIDLLQMSAGLKFVGNQEPGGSPQNTVLDHYFIYTGAHRRVQLLDHAAASSSRRARRAAIATAIR